MTREQIRAVAKLCTLPGLVEHGNAIRAELANGTDPQEALLEAWAAAQAVATFAASQGLRSWKERAQRIADLIAAHADAQTMPRAS